jgi:methylmalonyl-CoA decarboxylase subunit alpha
VDVMTSRPVGQDRLQLLQNVKAQAENGPSPEATEKQHAAGKLTARERINLLLDKGSFCEVEPLRRHRASGFGLERKRPYTDGVVTGWGTVEGRTVFLYAHDFRIFGGALGEAHAQKIHKIMDMALAAGAPLVSLNDGAGARIQEGVSALAGYGGIFQRNTRASGVIPQISVMLGPCAGGAAYSPALTDFVFMVEGTSQMFITGPDVVRAVTGQEITHNGLGGATVHGSVSGVSHFVYEDEETCLADVRYLLTLLPQNNRELPPRVRSEDPSNRRSEALLDLVPADANQAYDVRAVIEQIVDDAEYLEVHAGWSENLVCVLARLDGHTVGILPTSLRQWRVSSTSPPARRVHGSFSSVTPSTSHSSRWWTCPDSCPAWSRSMAASSDTVRSCSTPTATPRFRVSRSCCARPTAAPTS